MTSAPTPPAAPTQGGRWVAASHILGRDVTTAEPYPHICGTRLPSGQTLLRRDCAACAERPARPALTILKGGQA